MLKIKKKIQEIQMIKTIIQIKINNQIKTKNKQFQKMISLIKRNKNQKKKKRN